MEKLILIRKEIRDCKSYLNYLYARLNKEISEDKKNTLNNEITAVSYVKSILSELVIDYGNGIGDIKLVGITKNNDEELEWLSSNDKKDDSKLQIYWNAITLRTSLDIINENYLSKQDIYEYLYDYNEVMNLAKENFHVPIMNVFKTYMTNTNREYKANYQYYERMIKIHILFVNISVLSAIKDEDFEHLWPTDAEMGEKTKNDDLAFLKDNFINPRDSFRFKKTHIFNFIRNAFFHSNNNELYRITSDCNFVIISMQNTKPIPFCVKVSAGDIFRMTNIIQGYSHHVTSFELENQEQINLDNLFGCYEDFSRELDNVKLVRKKLPDKIIARKADIYKKILRDDILFSPFLFNETLKKYGKIDRIKYNFSEEQKKLLYNKFKYFRKYLDYIGMEYFIAPIVVNYMPSGIYKTKFLNFENVISHTYFFDYRNSMFDIIIDIRKDYMDIIELEKLSTFKKSVFDYLEKDIDKSKNEYLYLFDDMERENYNDVLLFGYVYGTINIDEKINIGGEDYLSENIRNAFTHGRWRVFADDNGKKCFYLYDDKNILADPDNACWSETFLCDNLKKTVDVIMENYKNSLNVNKMKIRK